MYFWLNIKTPEAESRSTLTKRCDLKEVLHDNIHVYVSNLRNHSTGYGVLTCILFYFGFAPHHVIYSRGLFVSSWQRRQQKYTFILKHLGWLLFALNDALAFSRKDKIPAALTMQGEKDAAQQVCPLTTIFYSRIKGMPTYLSNSCMHSNSQIHTLMPEVKWHQPDNSLSGFALYSRCCFKYVRQCAGMFFLMLLCLCTFSSLACSSRVYAASV